MGIRDIFGASVSYPDAIAVEAFGQAAHRQLAYDPDPLASIEAVLEQHPDFVMGHCFRAGIHLIASDRRYQEGLAQEARHLRYLAPRANAREQGHIRAIEYWLAGDFYASSQAYADVLLREPRDLCALQFGHQVDFLLGTAASMRDRVARALPHWSEPDAHYPYVLGMLAFGLEEAGHFPQAEDAAHKALALNPADTWAIHALAHCYEMQGKVDLGIEFLESSEKIWSRENALAIHNRWHLALYYLEHGRFEDALALHDAHMVVTPRSELMDLHDSAGMLWRLRIDGIALGDRWRVVADRYAEVADQGYLSFTDMHAMMAFVASGRSAAADALVRNLARHAGGEGTNAGVIRAAGLPIVKGFHEYGFGDLEQAKQLLSSVRHLSHLFGGSVAQRDIINLTLIDAAIRTRDAPLLEGLIAERTLLKPASPLTDFYLARIGHGPTESGRRAGGA
jgi:tetratricopeptide (TPR) repeat protein